MISYIMNRPCKQKEYIKCIMSIGSKKSADITDEENHITSSASYHIIEA